MKYALTTVLILCLLATSCVGTVDVDSLSDEATYLTIDPLLKGEASLCSLSMALDLQKICNSTGNTGRMLSITSALEARRIKYKLEFIDIWLPAQRNIVVEIPGKVDQVIYLTAHYDKVDAAPWSVLPGQLTAGFTDMCTSSFCLSDGARDNGASCSVMLELAHYFSNFPSYYTLRFVWFGGEEVGLRGSKCHVAGLSSEEWEKVVLAINLDGAGATFGSSYQANDLPPAWLDSLETSKAIATSRLKTKPVKANIPFFGFSDHNSFQGSNFLTTILGGCIFHAWGAVLPKADWLDLYKESKPTVFVGVDNLSLDAADWPIVCNLLLLPLSSWHGVRDSASSVKPIYMYNAFFTVRHFVTRLGPLKEIGLVPAVYERTSPNWRVASNRSTSTLDFHR